MAKNQLIHEKRNDEQPKTKILTLEEHQGWNYNKPSKDLNAASF
jgi:hypothetical protein